MAKESRPASLALGDLSAAIDAAVARVGESHGLRFGSDVVLGPGTILGRWLAEHADLAVIEKASTEISGHVAADDAIRGRGAISPAFVWQRGHILMGIIYEPGPFEE